LEIILDDKSSIHLVSVIIPVYNGAKYLRDAVDSVISQTYDPVEIIIIDDGSQDSTWEIIKSYQSKVRGFSKPNGGVASALNAGILQAAGEYIAWLSHDDIFLPRKIDEQVNFMEHHPEVGVCYTDFDIVDANKAYVNTVRVAWHPRQEMALTFLRNMYINGSTTMIRKLCFEKVGLFDEKLKRTQDLELWLRISHFFEFGHLPRVLLQSRSHPEQGALDFECQLNEESSTFASLFESLGCVTFFPILANVKDSRKQKALGLQKLGDEMLVHRHWYRFAMNQYRTSLCIWPLFRTKLKLFWAKLCILLLGDEKDSLCLVKRAHFLISQGDRKNSRALARTMLMKHPLRVDALILWISSIIPNRLILYAKSIKHRLNSYLSS
jgi:glycosyltransferase involved in cell wall biosynthesis